MRNRFSHKQDPVLHENKQWLSCLIKSWHFFPPLLAQRYSRSAEEIVQKVYYLISAILYSPQDPLLECRARSQLWAPPAVSLEKKCCWIRKKKIYILVLPESCTKQGMFWAPPAAPKTASQLNWNTWTGGSPVPIMNQKACRTSCCYYSLLKAPRNNK